MSGRGHQAGKQHHIQPVRSVNMEAIALELGLLRKFLDKPILCSLILGWKKVDNWQLGKCACLHGPLGRCFFFLK